MLDKALEFFKSIPLIYYIIGIVGIEVLYIVLRKGTEPVIKLVDQAVVNAENSFNSGEGKKKLEFAVNYVERHKESLPWFVKILVGPFLTKKQIIDLIEKSLNRLSVAFGSGKKVDIKGNEEKF